MLSKKLIKWVAFLLSLCLILGSFPAVIAEEESDSSDDEIILDEIIPEDETPTGGASENEILADQDEYVGDDEDDTEENKEETEESILSDEEAVSVDRQSLSIGFTRCVSRDLKFPTEGKNGTTITWKSERPDIISNEGKFTLPKDITSFKVTATIKKGKAKGEKQFSVTANNRSMYDVIMDYVNTMVEHGRDTKPFTKEEIENANLVEMLTDYTGRSNVTRGKSGLFYSMIDRDTLKYPAFYVEEWPRMTYNSDERGSGCVTSPEIWLYEMLYEISLMTGDKSYEKVADDALYFFLEHCQNSDTGVLAWGEHTLYDPVAGAINAPNQYATSKIEQEAWSAYTEPDEGERYAMESPFWMQKFFELNPLAWNKYLMSRWTTTIADPSEFTYSRHTIVHRSGSTSGNYLTMLNPMAFAYAWGWHYTGDTEYAEALHAMMNFVERMHGMNENWMFAQDLYYNSNRPRDSWMIDSMYAANWFYKMLPIVPDDIRERMERYIDKVTNDVMQIDLSRGKNSFAMYFSLRTGQPSSWGSLDAGARHYLYRWRQLSDDHPLKEEWGKKITEWVDLYGFGSLESWLNKAEFTAANITDIVEIHKEMYMETGDEKYLDYLLEIADFCIYDFWDMESLLPSMSHAQKKYYESTWGAPRVAYDIWLTYFWDIERKTGENPRTKAWDESDYFTKNMLEIAGDEEYMNKTRFDLNTGEDAE